VLNRKRGAKRARASADVGYGRVKQTWRTWPERFAMSGYDAKLTWGLARLLAEKRK
jgi:hypothetical protein